MKLANGLKIAAEILAGLWTAFMLFRQINRTTNGYFSLFNLFIFLVFYGLLMWGAWKKPWLGAVLVVLGVGAWIPAIFGADYSQSGYTLGIIVTGPPILAGLLFLLAAWKIPKTTT